MQLFLVVNGSKYSGWKSIRVTRSIESLSGSFALDVSDRWGKDAPWPILEEDACRVQIGDQTVVDGYVDKRSLSASADSRTLSYEGRDRAGALVDCSAFSSSWAYRKIDIAQFAAAIAGPHGIKVSVQRGLKLKTEPLLVVHRGETGFDAIKARCHRRRGPRGQRWLGRHPDHANRN